MTICCTLVFFFIRTSAWQRLINKAETYGTLNNRISLSTSEVFTLYRIYTAVRTAAISHNWYDLKIITRQNIVQIQSFRTWVIIHSSTVYVSRKTPQPNTTRHVHGHTQAQKEQRSKYGVITDYYLRCESAACLWYALNLVSRDGGPAVTVIAGNWFGQNMLMPHTLQVRCQCSRHEAYREAQVQPHSFLASALDGGEQLNSRPDWLNPWKEPRCSLKRGLGGPQSQTVHFGGISLSPPPRFDPRTVPPATQSPYQLQLHFSG